MAETILLKGVELDHDAIFIGMLGDVSDQENEIKLRAEVARQEYKDLLGEVAKHHSIPVMDHEVQRFVKNLPKKAVVLDVGGCWGWHWRKVVTERPDIRVYIVDLVRENLHWAKWLLAPYINHSVFLVHGDASVLPFADGSIDAYWSVQTLQHIKDVEGAFLEAKRVLKPRGQFACYFRNYSRLWHFLTRLRGRTYHVEGFDGPYYFSRGRTKHFAMLKTIFNTEVLTRFSEVLYFPGARFGLGKERSIIGCIDAKLSGFRSILGSFARQRSFHLQKGAQ